MTQSRVSLFLKPEPPEEENLLVDLFVDRESEMWQAIQEIQSVIHGGPRQILAVVGQARVGKSHLMKRVLLEVRRKVDAVVQIPISPGVPGGRVVLQKMLEQVHAGFHDLWLQRHPKDPAPLEPLDRIMSTFASAVSGAAQEVTVTEARTALKSITSQGKLLVKIGGLLSFLGGVDVGLESHRKSEDTTGKTRSIKVSAFSERTLSDLIILAHALMRSVRPDWTTLLVIDDFDLLSRNEDGFFDPLPLMQNLSYLAQEKGLLILTTVRHDTYDKNDKSFHALAFADSFKTDEPLLEIYDRHVRSFYEGNDPFRGGFARDAASRSEGRIGIFLRDMRGAFDRYRPRLSELSPEEIYREEWEKRRKGKEVEAGILIKAVRDQGGYLYAEDIRALRPTGLWWFVVEDYSSENLQRINPIALSYFREWFR